MTPAQAGGSAGNAGFHAARSSGLRSLAILHAIANIGAVRLVLDTATMVAAIRSDAGASRHLLLAALQRRFTLLVSVALLIEYESVMTRSEHLTVSGLATEDVATLLDAVALIAEPVRLSFVWRPMLPDADDDMVLEAAVNGRADAIVTLNRRDFGAAVKTFGIQVWAPGEAAARLGAGS